MAGVIAGGGGGGGLDGGAYGPGRGGGNLGYDFMLPDSEVPKWPGENDGIS